MATYMYMRAGLMLNINIIVKDVLNENIMKSKETLCVNINISKHVT